MRMICGALVATALSTGCLGESSQYCEATGVYCPAALACAPGPITFCGEPELVAACAIDKADFDACDYRGEAGTCRSGVCVECTLDRAGCTYEGWTEMTSPTSAHLRDVWATNDHDVYAVGDARTVLHYDGDRWDAIEPPSDDAAASFTSVWGSGEDVFVLSSTGAVFRHDGSAWTESHRATGLTSLWGASASDVFAVGLGGTVARFDGTGWTTTAPAAGVAAPLNAVWGDASRTFAVGNQGVVLAHDGTWSVSRPAGGAGTPNLTAIAGTTATDVYAVGLAGTEATLLRFDGVEWTPVPVGGGVAVDLFAVWLSTTGALYVAGEVGSVLRYVGGSWTESGVLMTAVYGLHGTPRGDVFAVGTDGTIVRRSPD